LGVGICGLVFRVVHGQSVNSFEQLEYYQCDCAFTHEGQFTRADFTKNKNPEKKLFVVNREISFSDSFAFSIATPQ
jgi:hypothetical protein